eukprot:GEMP01065353.1.p1 GENE.GEMP01065353.1~~GEMP01065353.1.p1  ORF type:complete len:379 (+),score=75.63 GEMP01065353.1:53-1138(+)
MDGVSDRRQIRSDDAIIQRRLHVLRRDIKRKTSQKVLPYPFVGRNMLFVMELPGSRAKLNLKSDGRFIMTLKSWMHEQFVPMVEGIEGLMRAEPMENLGDASPGYQQSANAELALESLMTYTMRGKQYLHVDSAFNGSSSSALGFTCRISPFFRPRFAEIQCLAGLPSTHPLYSCVLPCVLCDPLPGDPTFPPVRLAETNARRVASLPNLRTVSPRLPAPGTVIRRGVLVAPRDRSTPYKPRKLKPLRQQPKQPMKINFIVQLDLEEPLGDGTTQGYDVALYGDGGTLCTSSRTRHASGHDHSSRRPSPEPRNIDASDRERYWQPPAKMRPLHRGNADDAPSWSQYYFRRSEKFLQRARDI